MQWNKILSLIAAAFLLTSCSAQGPSLSTEFFAAEAEFDRHEYPAAEARLEKVLAALNASPKDQLPNLLSNQVNVHNYSIMTLELLAKCKYANGKYSEIAPLIEKESDLVKEGYTNTFKNYPTDGVKLYIKGFQAVAALQNKNFAGARQYLDESSDLCKLGASKQYMWLGDDGSPDFARYLWLKTDAETRRQSGQSTDPHFAADMSSLRQKLALSGKN